MAHAPAGPFARLPVPVPEADIAAEARRLFDKQRAEPHGDMMPNWERLSIPVRDAWLEQARRRLVWRQANEHHG